MLLMESKVPVAASARSAYRVHRIPVGEEKMAKRRKKSTRRAPMKKQGSIVQRISKAPAHGGLANDSVHVFVDDQNLFWGIVNDKYGSGFRIDFGRLLRAAAIDSNHGNPRGVASAYIAGAIPDDDSFWEIAQNQGFEVRRGFRGTNNHSKQDDAYLITDMARTVCKHLGPSTVILVAGDADYAPPLKAALEEGWRTEVAFLDRGVSAALESCVHEFRLISPVDIQLIR